MFGELHGLHSEQCLAHFVQKLHFVQYEDRGELFRLQLLPQCFIRLAEAYAGIYNEQSYVALIKHLLSLGNALRAQLTLIVEAGGVDNHYGAEGQKLHSLIYRVGSSALLFADNGKLLTGDGVDQAGLAGVTLTENTDVDTLGSGSCIQ